MVRRKEELKTKHYERMHGGNLYVDAIKFLEEEKCYECVNFFGKAIIPSGGSIGFHRHIGESEIYYILKGTAKVQDNDKEYILESGDMMQCNDGDSHSIENIGNDFLIFFAIVSKTHRS